MPFRLLTACSCSAAIVLLSPFMGQLQSLLRASLSTRVYVLLLGAAVTGSIAAAIATAFVRNRGHRLSRMAAIGAAVLLGLAYTGVMSTGDPAIDAVERVHFVAYGAIAVLFYRVWRRAGDATAVILPLLSGVMVGTLDEWLQWYIPYRVGEMHDVFLNVTALACGVLFGIALEPPPSLTWRLNGAARARVAAAAAAAVVVFASFVSCVHVGHVLEVDGIGRFESHHTIGELTTAQAERIERWQANPPIGISRLSREDQYLDEGLWHVRERNRRWDAGDFHAAWHENLILERFFVPVLDSPTYAAPDGTRWPPHHRADAQWRVVAATAPFVSRAAPRAIYAWSSSAYWTVVLTVALILAIPAFRLTTPSEPPAAGARPSH